MSRIQNILEKAEREGSVHRIRAVVEPSAAVAAVTPIEPPLPVETEQIAPPPAPAGPGGRAVSGTRLDPRLVAGPAGAIASEQYRALRTRILHADTGGAVNVLLVTSPGRAEGKTLTVANLGLTMGQEFNRRICVVDANFRDPQLHRIFGVEAGPGLSDVLVGAASLDEALITLDDHHITVLPAGAAPAHPAELLGTTAMRRTLDTLRSRFDSVLIDAPAAAPLADVGVLAPLADRVLLVVRAGVTARPAIHEAVAAVDSARLLGIVLNDAAVA